MKVLVACEESQIIYRQAAIDAALLFIVEYCGAAFDEDMQTKMKQRLEQVPSAQPGRYKWNPIKDGLPAEEGVYFVTDDADGMAKVYLDVFRHYEDGSPYWLCSHKVTAWMHTPEPYQGGDKE